MQKCWLRPIYEVISLRQSKRESDKNLVLSKH